MSSPFLIILKFKRIQKTNTEICDVVKVDLSTRSYFMAYAQFSSYKDWKTALNMKSDQIVVEPVVPFPQVDKKNVKEAIDQIYAENEALNRIGVALAWRSRGRACLPIYK